MSRVQSPSAVKACTRVLIGTTMYIGRLPHWPGKHNAKHGLKFFLLAGLQTHSRTCSDQGKSQMSLLPADDFVAFVYILCTTSCWTAAAQMLI